jgi:hypothetical protein
MSNFNWLITFSRRLVIIARVSLSITCGRKFLSKSSICQSNVFGNVLENNRCLSMMICSSTTCWLTLWGRWYIRMYDLFSSKEKQRLLCMKSNSFNGEVSLVRNLANTFYILDKKYFIERVTRGIVFLNLLKDYKSILLQ